MSKTGSAAPRRYTMTRPTFRRFALVAVVLGLIACLGVVLAVTYIGEDVVHSLYADKSHTVLQATSDLMGRFDISMGVPEARLMRDRDKTSEHFGKHTGDILGAFQPESQQEAPLQSNGIGREGYLFFFDEGCLVIGHPTLDEDKKNLLRKTPTALSICSEFKRIAEQTTGESILHHDWDGTYDMGVSKHSTVSWCTREPVTGWYLCASIHKSELDAALRKFVMVTALPPVALIMLLIGALLVFLNTLHKNIERTMDEKVGILQEEAEKLSRENARLKELDRTKSSFLSSVSHDLRNPLTSILGYAALVKREFSRLFLPLAEKDQKLLDRGTRIVENLEIVEHGGWRLSRLINDVIELDSLESGRVEWRDEVIDFRKILDRSVRAAQEELGEKTDLQLQIELRGDLPELCLDTARMEQAVTRLLTHMAGLSGRGRLSLIAGLDGDALRVEVHHSDKAIPLDQLEKCFDGFGQTHRGTERSKSQGKRLSPVIARHTVERHQGRIWVESKPGHGGSFVFILPLSMRDHDHLREMRTYGDGEGALAE